MVLNIAWQCGIMSPIITWHLRGHAELLAAMQGILEARRVAQKMLRLPWQQPWTLLAAPLAGSLAPGP